MSRNKLNELGYHIDDNVFARWFEALSQFVTNLGDMWDYSLRDMVSTLNDYLDWKPRMAAQHNKLVRVTRQINTRLTHDVNSALSWVQFLRGEIPRLDRQVAAIRREMAEAAGRSGQRIAAVERSVATVGQAVRTTREMATLRALRSDASIASLEAQLHRTQAALDDVNRQIARLREERQAEARRPVLDDDRYSKFGAHGFSNAERFAALIGESIRR